MKKEWFLCTVCRKKLAMVDNSKEFEGVYEKCPVCKNIIEITNKKNPEVRTQVAI